MPTPVLFIEPDVFRGVSRDVASYVPTSRSQEDAADLFRATKNFEDLRTNIGLRVLQLSQVSRPLMGYTIKPDSFAAIQIIDARGRARSLRNMSAAAQADYGLRVGEERAVAERFVSASIAEAQRLAGAVQETSDPAAQVREANLREKLSTAWTDWIATGLQEQRAEKIQFHEAFGANYAFVYGDKPTVFSISGQLFNTPDFPYLSQFRANWQDELRMTKLVEHNARAYLIIDDLVIEGYPISYTLGQAAEMDGLVSFSMGFWATGVVDTNHGGASANQFTDTRLSVVAGYDAQSRANRLKEADAVIARLGLPGRDRGLLSGDLIDTFPVISNVTYEAAGADTEELLRAAGVSPTVATQIARSTQETLAAVRRGALAALQGPAAATSFAQNLVAKTVRDAANVGLTTIDEKLQQTVGLRQGEVNRWFGYITSLLRAGFDGLDALPSVDLDDWLKTALTYRSLQQVVNRMGYTAASQIQTGEPPRPAAMVVPSSNAYSNSTRDFDGYRGGFGYRGILD